MKIFEMGFTPEAESQLNKIKNSPAYPGVVQALGLMQRDLRHPLLHTEECVELTHERGYKISKTFASPGYQIVWYFSFKKNEITIITILPISQSSRDI